MADVTVTPANVLASASAKTRDGIAGATILAGQVVYLDTTTSTYKLADSNGASPLYKVAGIALHGASSGQPIKIVIEDSDFTPGFTTAIGTIYMCSETAGGIQPSADITTGEFPCVLMVGKSTTKAVMKIIQVEVAVA